MSKLGALLDLLGPDYRSQGYTTGPLPLVPLDAFFDGNDDPASIQNQHFEEATAALRALEARDDVAQVLLGITQWEGEGTWPAAEYVYAVTSADPPALAGWLRQRGLHADDHGTAEDAHRPHAAKVPLASADGMRLVWFWMD